MAKNKPPRLFSIRVPGTSGIPEWLVCVGGKESKNKASFTQLRVYVTKNLTEYKKEGTLLTKRGAGSKCSYQGTWALSPPTSDDLGIYHFFLETYINEIDGLPLS